MGNASVPLPNRNEGAIREDQLREIWNTHCKGYTLPQSQVKKFLKRFAKTEGDYSGDVIGRMISESDLDRNGFYTYEQFRVLFFTVCSKSKIPVHQSLETSVAPRNQVIMDKFRAYTKQPFIPEEHNQLVLELWQQAYPGEIVPEIPSKEWDKLGFQGCDPSTDFRGSGLCGIESLLSLVKQSNFFKYIHNSAELHGLPFATASINVVMMCFEFLGWGFKSPGIPSGRSPQTFLILCKLLFTHVEEVEGDGLMQAKASFFKIFMVMFGTMEMVWTKMQAQYLDFPQVLTRSMEAVEDILKTLPDNFAIDRYLIENFSLDISLIRKKSIFQIWLPEGNYKTVLYNPDQALEAIITTLSDRRDLKDYQAYNVSGLPISDINIPLGSLNDMVVYYYPKECPPQVGKVYLNKNFSNPSTGKSLPRSELTPPSPTIRMRAKSSTPRVSSSSKSSWSPFVWEQRTTLWAQKISVSSSRSVSDISTENTPSEESEISETQWGIFPGVPEVPWVSGNSGISAIPEGTPTNTGGISSISNHPWKHSRSLPDMDFITNTIEVRPLVNPTTKIKTGEVEKKKKKEYFQCNQSKKSKWTCPTVQYQKSSPPEEFPGRRAITRIRRCRRYWE